MNTLKRETSRPKFNAAVNGMIIILDKDNCMQHICASAIRCTAYATDEIKNNETKSILILNSQADRFYAMHEIAMPIECLSYFVALARSGVIVDLQDYTGKVSKKINRA